MSCLRLLSRLARLARLNRLVRLARLARLARLNFLNRWSILSWLGSSRLLVVLSRPFWLRFGSRFFCLRNSLRALGRIGTPHRLLGSLSIPFFRPLLSRRFGLRLRQKLRSLRIHRGSWRRSFLTSRFRLLGRLSFLTLCRGISFLRSFRSSRRNKFFERIHLRQRSLVLLLLNYT